MIVRELLTKLGFKVDNQAIERFDQGISNVKSSLFAMTGAVAVAGTAVGFLLKQAGDIEQVEMAFETMTGSADKAKKLMEDITKFAASTPFELTGLIESSKQLLAFGVESEDIVKTMTNLGNISAGVGKDKLPTLVRAYGKIRVKGKASMEELNMLLEAGVPILDELAKNMNTNTEGIFKYISAGKIGFKDVDKAMQNLATGNGKFSGLMEKQSKSFLGIVSNIKDSIVNLAIAIGKDLLPEAKQVGEEIVKFFDANKDLIRLKLGKFFKDLAKFVFEAFKMIKSFLGSMYNLMELFGGFENVVKLVGKALIGLFAAKALIGIGQMAQGIFGLISALKYLRITMLLTQASALLIPLLIGAAIVALGLIIEDIIGFFQGKDSITGVIVDWIKNKFPNAFKFLKFYIDTLIQSLTFIYNMVSGIGKLIGTAFGGAASKIGEFLGFTDNEEKKNERVNIIRNAFDNMNQVSKITPATNPVTNSNQTSNNNVKVNAPITITVPEGTPPDQVSNVVSDSLNDKLGELFGATGRALEPQVEY